MVWVFFVFGAVIVVGIAVVAVGRVSGSLAQERPPAVYELAAAVDWIADRLPDEVTARISYDDLARILTWHLDWFATVGVASEHGQELAGVGTVREGAVAIDDAAVDAIVARALQESAGDSDGLDPVDVVCVLARQMEYLRLIGAVGEQATDESRHAVDGQR
jgi:hypothetical protein